MILSLEQFVSDFAGAMKAIDARMLQAQNIRSKEFFRPGIGPHSEAKTVEMVANELQQAQPNLYHDRIGVGVPYPELPRQKCDLCLGPPNDWVWAIEVKMLRFLGDNGKLNDNILMHILSPYPEHRSAVTDYLKLSRTKLAAHRAVLIYGFEHKDWPLEPALHAFEVLARDVVETGRRCTASFTEFVHPIHTCGSVAAWEIQRAPQAG